jgi:hypothetical protein
MAELFNPETGEIGFGSTDEQGLSAILVEDVDTDRPRGDDGV